MEIEKGKIIEIIDEKSNKVVKYKQKIKNNTINATTEIETDSLNTLISEIRKQIKEWNKLT